MYPHVFDEGGVIGKGLAADVARDVKIQQAYHISKDSLRLTDAIVLKYNLSFKIKLRRAIASKVSDISSCEINF
jgi:hypothetical protein